MLAARSLPMNWEDPRNMDGTLTVSATILIHLSAYQLLSSTQKYIGNNMKHCVFLAFQTIRGNTVLLFISGCRKIELCHERVMKIDLKHSYPQFIQNHFILYFHPHRRNVSQLSTNTCGIDGVC